MTVKEQLAAWYIARRIKKEIEKMKPLPKWVGALSAIGAVITAIGVGVQTGDWTSLAPAILAVIAALAHSQTGTSGKQ